LTKLWQQDAFKRDRGDMFFFFIIGGSALFYKMLEMNNHDSNKTSDS